MDTLHALIALWPSVADFAGDCGRPTATVYSWRQRGTLPAQYHRRIVLAARRRGIAGVGHRELARLAESPADRAASDVLESEILGRDADDPDRAVPCARREEAA